MAVPRPVRWRVWREVAFSLLVALCVPGLVIFVGVLGNYSESPRFLWEDIGVFGMVVVGLCLVAALPALPVGFIVGVHEARKLASSLFAGQPPLREPPAQQDCPASVPSPRVSGITRKGIQAR